MHRPGEPPPLPRPTFSEALSCAGGPVPGEVGGGGARRFFRSDFTDTPEMLLSDSDGPNGTERGFTDGELGVVRQPCGDRRTGYSHQCPTTAVRAGAPGRTQRQAARPGPRRHLHHGGPAWPRKTHIRPVTKARVLPFRRRCCCATARSVFGIMNRPAFPPKVRGSLAETLACHPRTPGCRRGRKGEKPTAPGEEDCSLALTTLPAPPAAW